MTRKELTEEKLAEFINEAMYEGGYKPRAYSVRGMMGRTCLGFTVRKLSDALVLGAIAGRVLGVIADRLMRGAFQDAMGMGQIVYFPDIEFSAKDVQGYPDKEEEEEEEN